MKARISSLDLFTPLQVSAKEPKKLCGAIMAILWILAFIAYCVFTIVTFDVSTPIVSIQDRDVTTMPGSLSLDSMNFSMTLVCQNDSSVSNSSGYFPLASAPFDCTSTPNYYNLTYGGSNKTMNSSNQFQNTDASDNEESFTASNYSYPFSVNLSQLDPSLTFATSQIYSQISGSDIDVIYFQINLTNLQISYSNGSVNLIPSIYYEEINANYKQYHYVFQIQDYYINSKSQFSNAQTYYRKVSMTKVFDSLDSNTGFIIKFMINPLAQSTTISYKKYTDLLAVLGGFWTSILGILALVYSAYWKGLKPIISKCQRKKKYKREKKNKTGQKKNKTSKKIKGPEIIVDQSPEVAPKTVEN